MQLLPLPDASGKPTMWINADHLVSVNAHYRTDGMSVSAVAEIKVDGMPLQRIPLGDHGDRDSAEASFERFLSLLQGRPNQG